MNTAIIKPKRMWIDGVSYVIKKRKRDLLKVTAKGDHNVNECQREQTIDSGDCSDLFQITTLQETGKFCTKFHLPPYYYKKLNEKHSLQTLKDLSGETNTEIIVPKTGNELIEVFGENKIDVYSARVELHSIVDEIRNSAAAAQFIALPTQSEEIRRNFKTFKEEILKEDDIEGMHESIFQSPLKLHLTIVVFSLMDENEKNEAIKTLNDYKTAIFEPLIKENGPLCIELKGIECMNNDYKKVNVLYAKPSIVNDAVDLQKIADELSEYFYKRGLVKKFEGNVKLHVTLLNTKYRKLTHSPSRRCWPKRRTFDATKIMEKYADYHFGTCSFDCVHLSLISSVGEDGFYKSLSSISV